MIFNTLKILMEEYGINQTKIAEKTGITRPTLLSLIRNENKSIRYDVIENICSLFNINMDKFLIHSFFDIEIKNIEMYSVNYHEKRDLIVESTVLINDETFVFSHDIKDIESIKRENHLVELSAYVESEKYYTFIENEVCNILNTLVKLRDDYEKTLEDISFEINDDVFFNKPNFAIQYNIKKDPKEFEDSKNIMKKIKEMNEFEKSMLMTFLKKELGE